MVVVGSPLLELKARRAQIDVQLLALRRRATELEREYARVEEARRRGEAGAMALFEVRDRSTEMAVEIARLEEDAQEIDQLLWRAERGDAAAGIEPTIVASLQTSNELDRVRDEILEALRELAEPLARYQHLAERQKLLTGRIRDATGKDNSYATYIDTALFRAGDYDADLEYVVELLKRARVVS
jgi:chromosome segregation ATPase